MSRHIGKIKDILKYNKGKINETLEQIKDIAKANKVIAIYNKECIGIMNSTKDLFNETAIHIGEILTDKELDSLANEIASSNFDQIIFSSMTFGWKKLMEKIHFLNPSIKIKVFWHGAHAMLVQNEEPYFMFQIIELLDRKVISAVAFAKESMADYYKLKGYNSYFLPNTFVLTAKEKEIFVDKAEETVNNKNIVIGMYSAGNRWEKNTFNQLSSISLIKNAIVDIVPVTQLVKDFCDLMNIKIRDESLKYMTRNKLFERIKQNDVTLNVTFTECSPMFPLESFELGVPCVTGNNHHYFKGTILEQYTIVKSEDDIDEIAEKINLAIEHKDNLIQQYKVWKKSYDKLCLKKLKEFKDC